MHYGAVWSTSCVAARPLAHLANDATVDERWPGVPMAVLLSAFVDEGVSAGEPYEHVVRILASVR